MNKILLRILPALLAIACLSSASCSGNDKKQDAKPAKTAAGKASAGNLPNYRYVDLDTILKRYNLAKDFEEEMLRMQNSMESTLKRHENSIQAQANSMQKKMQNNQYTEASYKQDQEKMAGMQNNAQREAASLQNNYQNAMLKSNQTIQDSINAFIQDYNKPRGYDAIFVKNATLYINPALDITDEVVEGLNARYNKVKK